MADPKRHHYIPRFMLKSFTFESNSTWQYDKNKKANKEPISRKNIENSALERHLYHIELEKLLSKLETKIAPILLKIQNKSRLTKEEKVVFCFFISILITRTLSSQNQVNKKFNNFTKPLIKKYLESNSTYSEEKLDKIINVLNIELTQSGQLQIMIEGAQHYAERFLLMDWIILTAPKGSSFIIGDNPFIIYPHPTNIFHSGIMQKGSYKFIPLHSEFSLIIADEIDYGNELKYLNISKKEIRSINSDILSHSESYAYGKSKEQLEKLIKISNLEPFDYENYNKHYFIKVEDNEEDEKYLNYGQTDYSKYKLPESLLNRLSL